MAAYRQAKASPNGDQAIESALKGATSVPLGIAQQAAEVGGIVAGLRPITNPNAASDLTVAALLAKAAVEGALANVEINLGSLKDATFAAGVRSKIEQLQR
jgi:formiminotetrahydrofolate cyclodeaminase